MHLVLMIRELDNGYDKKYFVGMLYDDSKEELRKDYIRESQETKKLGSKICRTFWVEATAFQEALISAVAKVKEYCLDEKIKVSGLDDLIEISGLDEG